MTYRFKTPGAQTYDKPKHDIPKLEELETDVQYALTINPIDQPRRLPNINEMLIEDWMFEQQTFLNSLVHIKYHLQLEISSRFHFHGWIEITDPILFYIYDLPKIKEVATIVIKKCGKDNVWHEYVNKQRKIVEPYLLSKGIPYEIGDYV